MSEVSRLKFFNAAEDLPFLLPRQCVCWCWQCSHPVRDPTFVPSTRVPIYSKCHPSQHFRSRIDLLILQSIVIRLVMASQLQLLPTELWDVIIVQLTLLDKRNLMLCNRRLKDRVETDLYSNSLLTSRIVRHACRNGMNNVLRRALSYGLIVTHIRILCYYIPSLGKSVRNPLVGYTNLVPYITINVSALPLAAKHGHTETVRLLLDSGSILERPVDSRSRKILQAYMTSFCVKSNISSVKGLLDSTAFDRLKMLSAKY